MPLARDREPLMLEAFQAPPLGPGTPSSLRAAAMSRVARPPATPAKIRRMTSASAGTMTVSPPGVVR
jgi:hypothetical protein